MVAECFLYCNKTSVLSSGCIHLSSVLCLAFCITAVVGEAENYDHHKHKACLEWAGSRQRPHFVYSSAYLHLMLPSASTTACFLARQLLSQDATVQRYIPWSDIDSQRWGSLGPGCCLRAWHRRNIASQPRTSGPESRVLERSTPLPTEKDDHRGPSRRFNGRTLPSGTDVEQEAAGLGGFYAGTCA